jgi:hypothetical protein
MTGSAPQKAAIVVLGMHRSGTSALTRVLNLLGCDLPKTLMGPSKANEAGHWESQAIWQLNDKLLRSAGSFWHDWQAFNPGWLKSPRAAEFHDEALTTLSNEFGTSRLFALKDPRICRLSDFWLPILEEFDAKPFVILPLRNPLEVAASIAKRDGFDPSIGHLLWLRHVLDAERATRGRPRVFVSYDGLMNGWRVTIERVQATLGFMLPKLPEASAGEIETFLSEALHHERATPAGVTDNPGLSNWLRESFTVLDNWARQGEKAADFAVLDRIGAAFDAAVPAFARPVEIGRQASTSQRRLEQELATARNQSAERDTRIAGLEREASSGAKDLVEIRARLAQTESALVQRRHEADQRTAELSVARQELQQLTAWRAQAETLMAGYKDHISLLLAHERNAERLKTEAAAEAQRLTSEKKALEGQLKERFGEVATLTRLLKDRENEARAIRRSVAAVLEANRAAIAPWFGRSRWWDRLWVKRQAVALTRAGLFDPAWYLEKYPDVKKAGIDPAEHYVRHGAGEGRLPRAAAIGP